MTRIRTLVLTEIISPYRIEPFNRLALSDSVDLEVWFFSEVERNRSWSVPKHKIGFSYDVVPGFSLRGSYQDMSVFVNTRIIPRLWRAEPDVVIVGGWQHPTIWMAMLIAGMRGTRRIVWSESTLRDDRRSTPLKERIKRWVVGMADGFIVPGSAHREYLLSLGAPDDRIWLAPNAVDNQHFARVGPDSSSIWSQIGLTGSPPGSIVLYVGRLRDEKGIPELLDAAERLGDRATVVIVGDGPDRARYERECERRGLRNVVFAGFHDQEVLPSLYQVADIFVLPTHSDPWGLVLNEAMAAGLPVVCADAAGAVPDLVRDGENGITVPSGDVGRLTAALTHLIENPDVRTGMGERSLEIVAEFSPAAMAAGFEKAIISVLEATEDGGQ